MNNPLLNIAVEAGRIAGKIISRSLNQIEQNDITEKQRHDFVTKVDLVAEEEIIRTIREAYPDHAVIAEESGEDTKKSDYTWVIDPLDGTLNFIHGVAHFAVSIAVLKKGEPEVGMVFDPIKNELFTAVRGGGAQLNNRKIRVSNCKQLDRALFATGFPFRDDQKFEAYLKGFSRILPKTSGIRRPGAASLDLAYVAAGRFDGYWEMGLKPWDIAAGILLVKEAGGIVTDLSGKQDCLKTGEVVCGNIKMQAMLLHLLS